MSTPITWDAPYGADSAPARAGNPQLAGAVRHWVRAALTRARGRRALADLDRRLLADIGIDAETARAEAAKPFWRV